MPGVGRKAYVHACIMHFWPAGEDLLLWNYRLNHAMLKTCGFTEACLVQLPDRSPATGWGGAAATGVCCLACCVAWCAGFGGASQGLPGAGLVGLFGMRPVFPSLHQQESVALRGLKRRTATQPLSRGQERKP